MFAIPLSSEMLASALTDFFATGAVTRALMAVCAFGVGCQILQWLLRLVGRK